MSTNADELLDVERAKLRALQAAELHHLLQVSRMLSVNPSPETSALSKRIEKLVRWAGYP